jgi:hypothetical protein
MCLVLVVGNLGLWIDTNENKTFLMDFFFNSSIFNVFIHSLQQLFFSREFFIHGFSGDLERGIELSMNGFG